LYPADFVAGRGPIGCELLISHAAEDHAVDRFEQFIEVVLEFCVGEMPVELSGGVADVTIE
jgi:hypothetical protein